MVTATSPRARFWTRMAWAHLLAYPTAGVAVVPSMSVVILARGRALEAGEGPGGAFGRWLHEAVALPVDEARVAAGIVGPALLVALAVVVWVHVSAIPWARADEVATRGARRRWLVGLVLPVGTIALGGLGGWVAILAGAS